MCFISWKTLYPKLPHVSIQVGIIIYKLRGLVMTFLILLFHIDDILDLSMPESAATCVLVSAYTVTPPQVPLRGSRSSVSLVISHNTWCGTERWIRLMTRFQKTLMSIADPLLPAYSSSCNCCSGTQSCWLRVLRLLHLLDEIYQSIMVPHSLQVNRFVFIRCELYLCLLYGWIRTVLGVLNLFF
jgi:hypothetical protein